LLQVPASPGTKTVPELLRLNDTAISQDGCKGATFHFTYTGSATYSHVYATTTDVGSSANPSAPGQPVTYTATVFPNDAAPGPVTGSVVFKDGSSPICSSQPLGAGIATCAATYATPGTHTITAEFTNSDGNFGASTSAPLTQTVQFPTCASFPAARSILGCVQSDVARDLSVIGWTQQTLAGGPNLNAVNAFDANHVLAVGDGCKLFFSSGTSWSPVTVTPACAANLTGVSVSDSGHGWAVGSGGTVLVCTANCDKATAKWSALSGSGIPATVAFTSVWGSVNTVYAVGTASGSGVIWACSANCSSATAASGGGKATWANVTPSGLGAIAALTGIADSGGTTIAVGSSGTVLVCKLSFCGSANWSRLTAGPGSTVPPASLNFKGAWTADASHVYAVGGSSIWACSKNCASATTGTGGGNSTWQDVTPGGSIGTLNSVTGSGPDNAWAVGSGGTILYCASSCTTSSASWVAQGRTSLTTANLAGVANAGANNAWAVGAGGVILTDVLTGPVADPLGKALANLDNALVSGLWAGCDGNHADPVNGGAVFDQAKSAVQQLTGIKNPPVFSPTVSSDVGAIVTAARLLVTTAINDAVVAGGNAGKIQQARNERGTGDGEVDKGHPDNGISHFKSAWQAAISAQSSPSIGTCP